MRKGTGRLLGLEVLALRLRPGQTPTFEEMKQFCIAAGEPISRQRLQQIEQRALRKLRIAMTKNGAGLELR